MRRLNLMPCALVSNAWALQESKLMIAQGITVGLLQENCYILGCEKTQEGVIIDPGDNAAAIMGIVGEMGLTIGKIINTHAHFDHVMAVEQIRRETGAQFYLHKDDMGVLRSLPQTALQWMEAIVEPVADPDEYLVHEQIVEFGEERLEVRFTPGHAPGHVVFVDHGGRQVFAGDTLFQGSIGRFDLPGADGPTLLRSIDEQLMTLDDDFIVYPGHGNATQIGIERMNNPFLM